MVRHVSAGKISRTCEPSQASLLFARICARGYMIRAESEFQGGSKLVGRQCHRLQPAHQIDGGPALVGFGSRALPRFNVAQFVACWRVFAQDLVV